MAKQRSNGHAPPVVHRRDWGEPAEERGGPDGLTDSDPYTRPYTETGRWSSSAGRWVPNDRPPDGPDYSIRRFEDTGELFRARPGAGRILDDDEWAEFARRAGYGSVPPPAPRPAPSPAPRHVAPPPPRSAPARRAPVQRSDTSGVDARYRQLAAPYQPSYPSYPSFQSYEPYPSYPSYPPPPDEYDHHRATPSSPAWAAPTPPPLPTPPRGSGRREYPRNEVARRDSRRLATVAHRDPRLPSRRDWDEFDDPSSGRHFAAAALATIGWYTLPLTCYLGWLLFLPAEPRANCVDDDGGACPAPRDEGLRHLVDNLPEIGIAVALAVTVALLLRWITTGWRSVAVGFAASVVGAGAATVLFSALSP